MKLKLVKALLLTSISVTCMAGVMAFYNYRFYKESTKKMQDANLLMLKTTEMLSLMKDAETGQRGYLLTGQPEHLRPYRLYFSNKDEVKQDLIRLAPLNPTLEEDLNKIFRLILSKEEFMHRTLVLRDSLGLDDALQLVKTNRGKIVMDSIRVATGQLLSKERTLLTQITHDYDKKLRLMNGIRYGIQAFVILMTLLSIVALSKKEKENGQLIDKLNESKATLECRVHERTCELEELNMELRSQNEEILSQSDQIMLQKDELLQLNEDKNKFIGMASHDLKSPLNRIKGFVGIIQASPSSTVASQKDYFDMMLSTISSTQKLISALLDINRMEQGRHEIKKEKLDVVPFLEQTLSLFDKVANKKHINLVFTTNTPSLVIESDVEVLSQVLENLISNAIKFSEKGKQVTLDAFAEDKKVQITVKDQGPGISKEEMKLLFGKFQKLSNKPTDGESSSGLGLSIVKDLVDSLDGTIQCESVVGQGSAFILTLRV